MVNTLAVLGDPMWDEWYHYDVRDRPNPEHPDAPVLTLSRRDRTYGGAANVFDLCARLGPRPTYYGWPPETIKRRLIWRGNVQARVDENVEHAPYPVACIKDHPVYLLVDYGRGAVTADLVAALHARGAQVLVDAKPRLIAELSERPMPGLIVKANVNEWDQVPTDCLAPVHSRTWSAIATMGKLGVVFYGREEGRHYIPAPEGEAVNVCGAGDLLSALVATALFKGTPILDAIRDAVERTSRACFNAPHAFGPVMP